MKKTHLIFVALFLLMCSITAYSEEQVFGVWELPSATPGTLYIYIEGSKFAATYRYQPYLGAVAFGEMNGSVSGSVLTGKFGELDANDDVAAVGRIRMNLDDSDYSLDVVFMEMDSIEITSYTADFLRPGEQYDYDEMLSIYNKVEAEFGKLQ